MIDNGELAPPPAPDDDVGDHRQGGGAPPERDVTLPPNCPVEPLGVTGQQYHFLDERRQYIQLGAQELGRAALEALFGRQAGRLEEWFPRKKLIDDNWVIVGWRPEAAGRALKVAAARLPLWNPLETIRGGGAWRGDAGELILHCGDAVLAAGAWKPPGRFGRHVYPASAPLPRPDDDMELSRQAGATTLKLLTTWPWRRRARRNSQGDSADVDARLLLGWIVSAMLGAALTWRSMCWVTGDASTGKSTLLVDCVGGLFAGGLLTTSDASAAGIWQTLGYSALPVAFDELEAQEDPRRAQAIVTLARQAASGGRIMRGGSDHKSTEFTARSSFLFSSILIPPLLNQDRSRLAILDLEELPGKNADDTPRAAPDLSPARLLALGRALRRRMIEMWPQLPERLETWRQALLQVGHGGRGADQLGTLLACADLALHDHPPSSDCRSEICALLTADAMAERDDAAPDHARCLAHLLTSELEVYRAGAKTTVADWIRDARESGAQSNMGYSQGEAEKALGNHGLKVQRDAVGEWLAVANSHQGLAKLFGATHWAARSGAAGVWMQALRRLPGAVAGKDRFNGVEARSTRLPLATVLPPAKGKGGA